MHRFKRLSSIERLPFHRVALSTKPRFATSVSFLRIRRMKRKAASPDASSRKAPKLDDYCNVEPVRDVHGNTVWPAPEKQIIAAQAFLKEW